MTDKTNNESMAEIAAHWVARLDRRELSAEELIELRDWATASPARMRELERMADAWESLDALGALRELVAKPVSATARPFRRFAVAAGIAAMGLVAWLVGSNLEYAVPVELTGAYVTDVGEQRSIEPGEGSTINLNTDSRMSVDFSPSERYVVLSHGEAFFDVASDDERPFIVETPHGKVVVTGTAFLVRVESTGIEVTVKEGHVQLHDTTGHISGESTMVADLQAGEIAKIEDDGSRLVDVIESERLVRKLGWRDGMLMFNGETLEEVVREVGRYTSIDFVIEDPEVRGKRIGGYFKVGEVDDLLGTLENDFAIEIQRIDDAHVVLSARQ